MKRWRVPSARLTPRSLIYVVYGVLALIPGANPSSSTGSSSSDAYGSTLTTVTTGTPAAWFTLATHVLGILALTAAAFLNVLLYRALAARRRRMRSGSP